MGGREEWADVLYRQVTAWLGVAPIQGPGALPKCDQGSSIDPNGCPKALGDQGASIDPNGVRFSGAVDQGSQIDPNG